MAGTKGLINRLIPIFKNPVSEITNMAETNNTSMAIQMIALHTIVNTLVSIITLIKTRIELGAVLGLLFMTCGYINVVKLSEDKKVYGLFTSYVIMIVIVGLLVIIGGKSVMNSLSSLF